MNDEWFYSHDGNQLGPVTASELLKLIATRQLLADDLVWKEGMPDWVPAQNVDGLFAVSVASVPSPAISPSTGPQSFPASSSQSASTQGAYGFQNPGSPSVRMVGPQSLPTVQTMRTTSAVKVLTWFFAPVVVFCGLIIFIAMIADPKTKAQWDKAGADAINNANSQVKSETDASLAVDAAAQAQAAADSATQAANAAAQAVAADAIKVSAGEIARAYDSNEVTADQRFKGKSILVTGVIVNVTKSELFEQSITAHLSDSADDPLGGVDADHLAEDDAVKLQKGTPAKFLCTGNGNPTGLIPDLDNCVLQ